MESTRELPSLNSSLPSARILFLLKFFFSVVLISFPPKVSAIKIIIFTGVITTTTKNSFIVLTLPNNHFPVYPSS